MRQSDMRTLARSVFRGTTWALTRVARASSFSDRREILLCCNDPLMADYLGPFRELFTSDPRVKFSVVFLCGDVTEDRLRHMRDRLPVREVSPPWANAKAWDLVICADHCFDHGRRRSPTVFIGHGLPGKCVSGSSMEYAYGPHACDERGRITYRRIFTPRESDARAAMKRNPSLRDIIVAVGDLQNDTLLHEADSRNRFRERLGFGPEEIVVFVLSTWGPHCLWHTMGDALLDEAEKLQPAFRFILSAHPHEYRPRPNGERVWGEYLRLQKPRGFLVREPSEDWIPYLVASDIVVSDYTNLVQSAVLLEKPVVLTPVPEQCIWKESITWKIREFAPILKDARRLREFLMAAQQNYPVAKLRELARMVHPHPGEAASRIRREIYGLLGIPPMPGQDRPCGDPARTRDDASCACRQQKRSKVRTACD